METQLLTTTKACRPSLQYLEAPITSMARIAPVQPHTLAPQRCRHLLAWPPLQSASCGSTSINAVAASPLDQWGGKPDAINM